MATKKEIRNYAEANGITREEARQHFINEAKKKSNVEGFKPDLGVNISGETDVYISISELAQSMIHHMVAKQAMPWGEYNLPTELVDNDGIEYFGSFSFDRDLNRQLLKLIRAGAMNVKLRVKPQGTVNRGFSGERFQRVDVLEVIEHGTSEAGGDFSSMFMGHGRMWRITNDQLADGLEDHMRKGLGMVA